MKLDKIYIVHYTKLQERKNNILSYINQFKTPYEFVEECDQEQLNMESLQGVYLPDQDKWNKKVSPLWDINDHSFRVLNMAEISCTVKHLLGVKKVATECQSVGLILEDDCMPLGEHFAGQVSALMQSVPSDWDVIFLGEGCGQQFIDSSIKNNSLSVHDGFCKAAHPASNCAEAYLLRANAARKIYKNCLPFQLVSDWELASSFHRLNLNIYWAVPSIFNQGSKNGTFESTLRCL